MYHLNIDGTVELCVEQRSECPRRAAIHGVDRAAVYAKLDEVKKDQLFADRMLPVLGPRPSPLAIGMDGAMMSYTDPVIVKEQYTALVNLGEGRDALLILDKTHTHVAARVRSGKNFNWSEHRVEPVEYSYEGGDGHYYHSTTRTWVAVAHYLLQTVALHFLMDKLETGALAEKEVPHFEKALGNTSASDTAYLAFNYNPARQPDYFWNKLKNRLVREGFSSTEDSKGNFEVTVPSFLWDGLDDEHKARMATSMISDKYSITPGVWRRVKEGETWAESYLDSTDGLSKSLQATFANIHSLHGAVIRPGDVMKVDTGQIKSDASYPLVEVEYEFTPTGFKSRHKRELFISYHERGWRDSRTPR